MNRYYLPVIPLLGIVTTVTLQTQPVFAVERSEIAAQVKEFTVQIEGQETTGTGTIIERNDNSYTILTCWHVVNAKGNFKVITPDGETHQVTDVKNLKDIDLAILQFTSNTNYQVAELGDSQTITEGTSNYVVGYPDPIPGIPERAYMFLDANIVSKLSQGEKGYQIVHNNPTTGGSSGGGIFDSNGLLVGVNGRTTSDAEGRVIYGLAIPLQIYLAAKSNFITPTNITPPQDFVSVGKRKLKAKDYQGAINEFSKALASNPNDIDALSGRAAAYLLLQDFAAAMQDLDTGLERNPNNAVFFFYRGYAYYELKEYDKAIPDYTEAIRLNPELAVAYNNRGNNYGRLKEYDKAIADFTEAIRLNPEYVNAYYSRGLSYQSLKEYDKAIADYTEAIRLNPELAEAYNNRGISYGGLGEYNKAIADLDEAIRLNPELAVAYNNRGNNYGHLKEYDKAIADYTEAIRLNPELAEAYYSRGASYAGLADKINAIEDLQQAADLFQQQGNTEWYQKALNKIKELQ